MAIKKKKMKMMTLDQMKDKDIGKIGTADRDKYEFDLRMEVLGEMIKSVRKERKLTQETTWKTNRRSKVSNFKIGTKCKECNYRNHFKSI